MSNKNKEFDKVVDDTIEQIKNADSFERSLIALTKFAKIYASHQSQQEQPEFTKKEYQQISEFLDDNISGLYNDLKHKIMNILSKFTSL